jgi:hypothetical protein
MTGKDYSTRSEVIQKCNFALTEFYYEYKMRFPYEDVPKGYFISPVHDSVFDMGIHDSSELKKSGNKSAWEFSHDR